MNCFIKFLNINNGFFLKENLLLFPKKYLILKKANIVIHIFILDIIF